MAIADVAKGGERNPEHLCDAGLKACQAAIVFDSSRAPLVSRREPPDFEFLPAGQAARRAEARRAEPRTNRKAVIAGTPCRFRYRRQRACDGLFSRPSFCTRA
jgi:hypothetical protein